MPIVRQVVPVLALASSAAAGPPSVTEIAELEGLHERWVEAMDGLGVPGVAVVVVKDGEIIAADMIGPRDPKTGEPITTDSIFYIASITKTYLAAGIMTLVDEGRVDLDAPVKTYLPRFQLADEAATSKVTVRDLLCHRLGINSGPIVFLDAYSGQITEDRYYRLLAQVEPGGSVAYTNVHYTLLGRIIESVTGESWKDYLQTAVFEPAGLTRTTAYASRLYGDADAAIPTVPDGDGWTASRVRKTDRTMHAAGGMGTSPTDAARWLQVQLNDGIIDGTRVLSSESLDEMHDYQVKFDEPRGRIRRMEGFGMAWQRGTFRDRPYLTHGGGYIGAATHISFMPEQNLGVVVFCNSGGTARGLLDIVAIDVYDRLLGESGHDDLLPRYLERAAQINERIAGSVPTSDNPATAEDGLSLPAARYAGRYSDDDWGTVELVLAGGELSGSAGDLPFSLHTTFTDQFVAFASAFVSFECEFIVADGEVTGLQVINDGQTIIYERE